MSTYFHNKVSLAGFNFDDCVFTFVLNAAIVEADVGKPVSIDTSAANKVKIAADGKRIIGKLMSYEDRGSLGKYGAIALDFTAQWTVKAADALAIGDMVVGAANGEVRKWVTNDDLDYAILVVEVASSVATCVRC